MLITCCFFRVRVFPGTAFLIVARHLAVVFPVTAFFTGIFFLAAAFLGTDYLAEVLFLWLLFSNCFTAADFFCLFASIAFPRGPRVRMVGGQLLMC